MKKRFFPLLFFPFFLVVEIINWLSLFADEVFFPSHKRIVVSSPLYITGMPRTATTLAHNIISCDTKGFTTMKLWEIAFAPSICQKRFWLFIWKFDSKLDNPLIKTVKYVESRILKQFDHFHPLSIFNVEEDEYLLIHNFTSELLIFFFPVLKFLRRSYSTSKTDLTQIHRLEFYHKCIKKHLYVFGKEKTYLAKSPAHILRYHSLKKVFPDIRIIYMLRNPHKSIPSTISLFQNFNTIFNSRLNDRDIITHTLLIADTSFHFLTQLNSQEINPSFIVLKFEEFVNEPELAIKKIYKSFHLKLAYDVEKKIRNYCVQQSTFKSKHKYSLKKYGLTKEIIVEKYLDIYRKFYRY